MHNTKPLKMLPMEVRKENLAVAYSIIGGIPAKNFDLNQFSSNYNKVRPKPTCGTIGCSLGWLAMHPYFTAQGLYLERGLVRLTEPNGSIFDVERAAQHLFGKDAFQKYFNRYQCGKWDDDLMARHNLPDRWDWGDYNQEHQKTLALARLKRGYQRIHK